MLVKLYKENYVKGLNPRTKIEIFMVKTAPKIGVISLGVQLDFLK